MLGNQNMNLLSHIKTHYFAKYLILMVFSDHPMIKSFKIGGNP